MQAAVIIFNETDIKDLIKQYKEKLDLIIVDEAQFCKAKHIDQLKEIAVFTKIPVYAYGLKNDFSSHLFEGSKRLIELSDDIRTLEKTCEFCDEQAEINARFDKKGKLVTEGGVVDIGGNEKYKALCYKCWKELSGKND
jgi:thymidine kinase